MMIEEIYQLYKQSKGITTDTRRCEAGMMFVALKGENFDGNSYAEAALAQGCSYAVVDDADCASPTDKRIILVEDALRTLQLLAQYHRRVMGTTVVGITGTNGKTTTKELVAAVLGKRYRVLYTQGNLNNHIGVPLTLLGLTREHEIAVVEMGANHPGDIKELVEIAEPDYGLITNVGMAHLQGFGSLEGVIRTKGELYDYLRTTAKRTVFLNADNAHLRGIAEGLERVCYGQVCDADIRGEVVACDPYLRFRWRRGEGEWHAVATQLIGSYNIDNALCAATVGCYFGIPEREVTDALAA
jgi:UDP-N-acetylmuramoyl-tripeptide--D-alanyl-D-alanine ligase